MNLQIEGSRLPSRGQCTDESEGYAYEMGIHPLDMNDLEKKNQHPLSSFRRTGTQNETFRNRNYDLEFE